MGALSLKQERLAATFAEVAIRALPHRRLAGRIVRDLAENIRRTFYKGNRHPFFTHCELAKRRGRQHRNTSREIVKELDDLGIINAYAWRYGRGCRFSVNWSTVFGFIKHGVPGQINASGRTVEDWKAEVDAYHAEQAAARRERERAEASARAAAVSKANREALSGTARRQSLADAFKAVMSPRTRAAAQRRIESETPRNN